MKTSNALECTKKIFEAINENNPSVLVALLAENPENVNVLDEDKMTPLQHACYKGNREMVQILLDHGADVKLCEHQHNYTALHFAALSGNIEVCLMLLEAGAKPTEVNTVGRTPAQMAAFVGHHSCVSVINNYVLKSEVEYYTQSSGTQTVPLLPPLLLESFHKFIVQVNVHPIKVVMNLYSFAGLQDHLPDIKKVLELMSDKEMKKGAESSEVLSFKFYYLAYVVGEVIKLKQKQEGKEKKGDVTELIARQLLKPGKDDHLEIMDAFLKEGIREFPHRDSTLFRHMVASLSGDEPAPALLVVHSSINGQRGFLDTVSRCSTCGEENTTKKCAKCKAVQYCDRNCQRLHWTWHKKSCARPGTQQNGGESSKPNKQIDMKEIGDFLGKM